MKLQTKHIVEATAGIIRQMANIPHKPSPAQEVQVKPSVVQQCRDIGRAEGPQCEMVN